MFWEIQGPWEGPFLEKCSGSNATAAWGQLTAGEDEGWLLLMFLLCDGGWNRSGLWMHVTWWKQLQCVDLPVAYHWLLIPKEAKESSYVVLTFMACGRGNWRWFEVLCWDQCESKVSWGPGLLVINNYKHNRLPPGLLLFFGCHLTLLNWLDDLACCICISGMVRCILWQLVLVVVVVEMFVAQMLKWSTGAPRSVGCWGWRLLASALLCMPLKSVTASFVNVWKDLSFSPQMSGRCRRLFWWLPALAWEMMTACFSSVQIGPWPACQL